MMMLMLRFPSRKRPIILNVLIATCSADSEFSGGTDKYKTPVILTSTGRCSWFCPASFTSTCPIDVQYFPFDRQKCVLKFGSWTYEVNSRLNRPFPSCVKTSPLATSFIWKCVQPTSLFSWKSNSFSYEWCCTDSFWNRGTRKWPIAIKLKILLQ